MVLESFCNYVTEGHILVIGIMAILNVAVIGGSGFLGYKFLGEIISGVLAAIPAIGALAGMARVVVKAITGVVTAFLGIAIVNSIIGGCFLVIKLGLLGL